MASSNCRPTRRSANLTPNGPASAEPVIEINLTPNRPDCTGVNGIARDLGAASIGTFKDRPPKPVKGTFPCPVKVTIESAGTVPGLRPAAGARRQERPLARLAAKAAHGHRPAADQRAGRHHQFHHLRPRPPAARVRRRKGARQSHRAPRQERRDAARARRQDLHARCRHVRDRRREGRRIARPASWAARQPAARRRPPTC